MTLVTYRSIPNSISSKLFLPFVSLLLSPSQIFRFRVGCSSCEFFFVCLFVVSLLLDRRSVSYMCDNGDYDNDDDDDHNVSFQVLSVRARAQSTTNHLCAHFLAFKKNCAQFADRFFFTLNFTDSHRYYRLGIQFDEKNYLGFFFFRCELILHTF